ncbi:cupin domain-containing protein [Leptospira santarosai]|uniref:cupin domain-containing protein n=1 Tax=Leptospira santarosai TaxID=28183 RepID=UPI000518C97B|nr:cupin domain-containing protein [Leptospira santarosai]MDI7217611.1 cupin domain-containing protein [Leptospira santarosai]
MKLVSTLNSEYYTWGVGSHGWHFLKRDDLSIILEEAPPGDSEIKHFHNHARQFFFILEGTATLEIGKEVHMLQANEGIEVEPRIAHKFRNNSDSIVRFLVISMPRSHGDRTDVE